MAGKFSIYKYVRLQGKGWRYARAAFHSNGKIKPNIVIVKGANRKATEEKHAEGAYFLNFNNTWIPVGADALEAQHQRKLKLNQVEYERLSGKTTVPGETLFNWGGKSLKTKWTHTSPTWNWQSVRTRQSERSAVSSRPS